MKIIAVPFEPSWNDPEHNLRRILEELDAIAKFQVPDLFIFPEASLTGFNVSPDLESVRLADDSLSAIAKWAESHKTNIWLGAFVEVDGRVLNSILNISGNSHSPVEILYEKLNLFQFAGEHLRITSGKEMVVVDVNGLRIGMAICFDLRSLGLFRRYRSENVDLVVIPASWPLKRNDHLIALAKARALDFGFGVLIVNRSGSEPDGTLYSGDAILFMPDGTSLEGENVVDGRISFTIDRDDVTSRRLGLLEGLNEEFRW